jgi:ABC-2 type transport system permease protein
MGNYLRTTLALATTQLKRNLRDPVTLIVLLGIPVLLILIFGSLLGNTDNISVRVAVINNAEGQFAKQFEDSLGKVKVLKLPEKPLTLEEARKEMDNDALDGIIELPAGFGQPVMGVPSGVVKLYYDQADAQTGDIVSSIMQSVVEGTNKQLTQVQMPISVERTPINVNEIKLFDNIFAMFTGVAIAMVGIFGVASSIPADKKTGALRRLRVTPLRASQVIIGTMLTFAVIGIIGVALLTALAVFLFELNMRGNWLVYSGFAAAGIAMMLGMGLAIGSLAKNTTQADIYGQIVFLGCMAVSGVWFPRALMPEWLQGITAFVPLTPIIDGIRDITTGTATLVSLAPELGVIAVWAVILYALGIKMFRWT